MMSSLESYKDVVASCAFFTTMLHMLTGTLVCKDICQKGTSRGFDSMPFVGGIGMSILNLRYGLIVQDPTMININLFGIAVNVAYMIVYYLYSPDKSSVLITLQKATAFVAIILGYTLWEKEEHLEFRYGMLTTVLFLTLIASPLFNLAEIIRTKSTASLPFPLIFMGTIVSFQWLLYGLILKDTFLIIQNSIGFSLSFIQLSLFAIYPSTKEADTEKLVTDKKEK